MPTGAPARRMIQSLVRVRDKKKEGERETRNESGLPREVLKSRKELPLPRTCSIFANRHIRSIFRKMSVAF